MKKTKPYAIVIGLDGMNGLQTARILAQRGIPVIGVAKDPNHYCCRTNVCEKIYYTDTESIDLVGLLEKIGPRLDAKAILFPCYDLNVLTISRNRKKLTDWYHIALPTEDVIEMLLHKTSFYTYAQRENLPIPLTFILNSEEDVRYAAQRLTFPCALKPSVRSKEWENKSKYKVYKVSRSDELINLYNRFKDTGEDLIVQDWIEGSESNLYSCNCYFNVKAEPVVTFVARKIRQWPPDTGVSCLGEECKNDTVLNETIRLFHDANHFGLGYLEMKRDEKSGKLFIMEPNVGRPTGRSAIAEAGGVDLLYTMYCDVLGWPLPLKWKQTYSGVKWMHIRRDFQSAFYYWQQGKLSIKEWALSVRGKKAFALFSWKDPSPFIADIVRGFSLLFRRKRTMNEKSDEY